MNTQSFGKYLLIFCFVAVVGIVAYSVLTAPDKRSFGDKMGDAIDQLDNRTTAEKIRDDFR